VEESILLVGCGNMGSALVRGLCRDHWHKKFRFLLYDAVEEKSAQLAQELKLESVKDMEGISPHFLILAVKPKDVEVAFKIVNKFPQAIILSVVAGVNIHSLTQLFAHGGKIVRLMPNLCVEVGEGVVPISFSDALHSTEKEEILFLLSSLGWVLEVEERYLDYFTVLSGSGPALVALFIEGMMDAGVEMGIPWETSFKVALQTVLGTASLLKDKELHPAYFKNLVASPGGITIAGVRALKRHGFEGIVMEGFREAYKRLVG